MSVFHIHVSQTLKSRITTTLLTALLALQLASCGSADSAETAAETGISNKTPQTIKNSGQGIVFSGDDSASIARDLDPDGDGMLELTGSLSIAVDNNTYSSIGAGIVPGFIAETLGGDYGSLSIDSSGNWQYIASTALAAIRSLTYGESLTETIYVNTNVNEKHPVVITITGVDNEVVVPNQPAVISGTSSASVTEDNTKEGTNLLVASGKLNISDNDPGEAAFISRTLNSGYGRLTINAAGNWTYSADNNQSIIQNLNTGSAVNDRFVISSLDGTKKTITITIRGLDEPNSPATITGNSSGSVTEDIDPDGDNLLEVTGRLYVTDSDAGEAAFIARTVNGNYGSLGIDAAGNWRYAASNTQSAIQNLNTGSTLTDAFTVSSIDGTKQAVSITIKGADEPNSPATFTGSSSGSVTEDIDPDADGLLEVAGRLYVSDSDPGEAGFVARTVIGNYGSLNIDTVGNWSYAAGNSQNAIQNLATGSRLTDYLTVSSIDGTTVTIQITINGVNEPVATADINLSWVAPSAREDNTALSLSEISGYRIYYGTASGNYPDSVTINDGSTTSHTITGLAAGTYYLVMTTLDTDGRESTFSTEVVINN